MKKIIKKILLITYWGIILLLFCINIRVQVPNDDCANTTLLGNLGNLKIIINSLNTYEKDLIYIYY